MLIDALPDLALLIGRDGVVLAQGGGSGMSGLRPRAPAVGKPLEASWPAPVAALLRQLARKSIAQRTAVEARFTSGGSEYTAQASPRGPARAVCTVRAAAGASLDEMADTGSRPAPQLDRRGFLQRFKD